MELENRSAVQITRDARPDGSIQGYRSKTPPTAPPPSFPPPTRLPISVPRRKRSTEAAFFTDEEDPTSRGQENKRVLRQRTSSTTSIATLRIRPSKSTIKQAADVGPHPSSIILSNTLTATIPSAGAIPTSNSFTTTGKQKLKARSKFKPFKSYCTNISGLDESRKLKGPRQKARETKAVKTVGSAPSFTTPPAILNVGHADLANRIVTHTTAAFDITKPRLSIDDLDDLLAWDMESLPSIPSPPDSPEHTATRYSTPNSNPPPSVYSTSNPFADINDDDGLFENEIPFPLTRSRVVLENMGVKKSKNATANMTKARNISASILNRHVAFPRTESPPPAASAAGPSLSHTPTPTPTLQFQQILTQVRHPPSGLPHPLPLRSLCQNTLGAPHPLVDEPPASTYVRPHPAPAHEPAPGRRTPTTSSESKRDAWGSVHLGASDCELSIVFPQTSHYEVWDMNDSDYIACPALLYISAKDALSWTGTPLALPDVSLLDILCDAIPVTAHMAVYDRTAQYSTSFIGGKTGTPRDDLLGAGYPFTNVRSDDLAASGGTATAGKKNAVTQDAITIEGKWVRTYARPGVEGRGAGPKPSNTSTTSPSTNINARYPNSARGWYLKIWIPIPTHLFAKRETRSFRIYARVWMTGHEGRVLSLDRFGSGYSDDEDGSQEASPLVASTEMTVSHLRREREMDVGWW